MRGSSSQSEKFRFEQAENIVRADPPTRTSSRSASEWKSRVLLVGEAIPGTKVQIQEIDGDAC
jgi:hypothetical protein